MAPSLYSLESAVGRVEKILNRREIQLPRDDLRVASIKIELHSADGTTGQRGDTLGRYSLAEIMQAAEKVRERHARLQVLCFGNNGKEAKVKRTPQQCMDREIDVAEKNASFRVNHSTRSGPSSAFQAGPRGPIGGLPDRS